MSFQRPENFTITMDADVKEIKDVNDTVDIYQLLSYLSLYEQSIIDSGPPGYKTIVNIENLKIFINSGIFLLYFV